MKTLNYLVAGMIGLGLNSCRDSLESNTLEKSKLEEFNQKNKTIYEDYIKFIKQNGKSNEESKDLFVLVNSKLEVSSTLKTGLIALHNGRTKEDFCDFYFDGMDEWMDFYIKGDNTESIKNMPKEKQLEIAKKYVETLIKIMHDVKYAGY